MCPWISSTSVCPIAFNRALPVGVCHTRLLTYLSHVHSTAPQPTSVMS
jgi:hypothetical protein